jgi:hypothetical protein
VQVLRDGAEAMHGHHPKRLVRGKHSTVVWGQGLVCLVRDILSLGAHATS